MNLNYLDENEWQLFTQALLDGFGYPKSEENQKQLVFDSCEIKILLDELLENNNKKLNSEEKQMILNCLDGALHYVDIDIPSLYDISEIELKNFKEQLEKRWDMKSKYGQE